MTKNKRRRVVRWLLFVIYIAAMVYLMFFSEELGRGISADYRYNLVPFKEIKRFLTHADILGFRVVLLNLLGNVLVFVPFGYELCPISGDRVRLWSAILYSVALSTGIELIQLLTRVGSCDVDDIILNTLGGLLGYVLFRVVHKRRKDNETL